MYLEILVIDAVERQRLGRFWDAVMGGERLRDEPDAFEPRLTIGADRCSTWASSACADPDSDGEFWSWLCAVGTSPLRAPGEFVHRDAAASGLA